MEMPNYEPDKPDELPSAPSHLSETATAIFSQLVRELMDAQIPIKRIDGHAISISMAAT